LRSGIRPKRSRRLQAWWTPSGATPRYYDYDPLGNLVEHGVATPGTPNQIFDHTSRPHAVSSAHGKSYVYDADGNLATVLGPGGNAYRVFDSQNTARRAGRIWST